MFRLQNQAFSLISLARIVSNSCTGVAAYKMVPNKLVLGSGAIFCVLLSTIVVSPHLIALAVHRMIALEVQLLGSLPKQFANDTVDMALSKVDLSTRSPHTRTTHSQTQVTANYLSAMLILERVLGNEGEHMFRACVVKHRTTHAHTRSHINKHRS